VTEVRGDVVGGRTGATDADTASERVGARGPSVISNLKESGGTEDLPHVIGPRWPPVWDGGRSPTSLAPKG